MDLLVLSEVRWGYFRTRKQFLLSRFPERWRIFFAQPPAAGADDPWEPRREGRVTYFTVPFLKPATTHAGYNLAAGTPWGRAAIEAAAEWHLHRQLRRLGVEREPAVMVSNIYAPGLLARLRRKLILYDFNDDPFQFSGTPAWARSYWPRTVSQAEVVTVVSEFYRRRLAAEVRSPLILLGNGVEANHFASPAAEPPELAALPRPRIGYVGLLSHFLDFDTLEALRRNRRGGTLVFLGPGTPATEPAMRALAGQEGVAVLGPRPYEELPGYLQHLDVGIIPFRASDPFVQGINPNKIYQYLAAGLPVVSTPVLDLPESPPDLLYASDAASMVTAVHAALAASATEDDRARRRAAAAAHDWNALATRLVSEIEARLPAA